MRQLVRAFLLLLASVFFVEARPALLVEPTFEYDVQTERSSTYDDFGNTTFDYDARAELSAIDVWSEAANCTHFKRPCELFAAKTAADISKFERVTLSKGTRAQIWERSKAPDGKVYDPTGVEIRPGEPWQPGHRPSHKFSDAQQRAAQEGWDAET